MPENPPEKTENHTSVTGQHRKHMDDLIRLINSIDWKTKGLDDFKMVPPAHPMGPVFDSLARIKQEIDGLLNEHNELKSAKEEAEASNKKLADLNINLEKAVARAKAMTEKAQTATREKSEFLANMSHEIRTAMNAIMGFTDLMVSTHLTDKQNEFLSLIRRSNESLLGIINDILDFSKIEAGKLNLESKDFMLRDLMESLCDMFSRKPSEKDIELIISLTRQVPRTINGDPLRIKQILINLITNAIKFTDKGEVVVKAGLLEKSSDHVEILFSITDTGIGIKPDRIDRLFEPFSQADGSTTRKYGGTGLGLTICKRLVEMMGGEIWAESEVDKGSCFHFKLRFGYQQRKLINKPIAPVTLEKIHTLIVDDSRAIQRFLKDFMKQFSVEAHSVGSGEEAIIELASSTHRNPYDLAIVDWKVPGMDGLELIDRIRKNPELGRMKLIMLTAFGNERVKRRAEAAGVNAFLHKPLKESVLYDTIMEVFGEKTEKDSKKSASISKEHNLSKKFVGLRVLLVEDNSINQELAVTILEKEKLVVDVAMNGKEAVERLNNFDYDLVLMDVQMPEMDGYEATRRIRGNKKYDHMPIIAMTADAMKGTREECIMAGMDDYLAKPIHVKELFKILSRWIDPEGENAAQDHSPEKGREGVPVEEFPNTLPGINIQNGLSRLGGNKDIYTKLLIRLSNDYSESTEKIKTLINQNELTKARKLIHTIKGVAGNLSALELYDAADKLGVEIKKNNLEPVNDLLDHYEDTLKKVLNSINILTLKYIKLGAGNPGKNPEKINVNHSDSPSKKNALNHPDSYDPSRMNDK